eukprot:3206849-Pyramimonas_sp.AAC.1
MPSILAILRTSLSMSAAAKEVRTHVTKTVTAMVESEAFKRVVAAGSAHATSLPEPDTEIAKEWISA